MIASRLVRRRAFTLVEVLIVVVILGILAATVLPQFVDASSDSRETALMQDLQILRTQIELYAVQHGGKYPAASSTTASDFESALLKSSDEDGTVGEIGTKPLGPYLIGQLPLNPFNQKRDVKVVDSAALPAADGTTGWLYSSRTGQISANVTGTTSDGTTALAEL